MRTTGEEEFKRQVTALAAFELCAMEDYRKRYADRVFSAGKRAIVGQLPGDVRG